MSPSPSTLERLRDASWPVVMLLVLLVMNGGLVALGGWAAGRERD